MKEFRAYLNNIEPALLHHVSGKMGELIQLIRDNNFVSEEALIHHFCKEKRERKYYQNLKSRTLKILQAFALISSSKEESGIKKN